MFGFKERVKELAKGENELLFYKHTLNGVFGTLIICFAICSIHGTEITIRMEERGTSFFIAQLPESIVVLLAITGLYFYTSNVWDIVFRKLWKVTKAKVKAMRVDRPYANHPELFEEVQKEQGK